MAERPARVALFVTCLVDLLYPDVGAASAALLREAGFAVEVPEAQVCCGQPAFNSGFDEDARRVGRTLLRAFDGAESVVAPSGSCAAMVRVQFPRLFAGTRDAERARGLAARTFELTEFLVDVAGWRPHGTWEGSVTFHDACHGLRELGLRGQGRALLGAIDGLTLAEMARPEACCGFGGTFSVRLPEVATAMADDKLSQAADTGADAIVAGDSGCLMHLAGRLHRSGSTLRPLHVATVMAQACGLLEIRPAPGGRRR